MHGTLEVTFGEDYCRARREHAAENRATARRIALNDANSRGVRRASRRIVLKTHPSVPDSS